ncbi:hypothetical protein E2I00_020166 [Balaenoptera physalus]|uniref:Proline-rich protein 5 n=1 Tax=Balaenoptera physalus TaxID=9770 RepID=A0A643C8S9_BALPH|nr:hypothetical protein E2I00_020166 [Balaenoptera physalus]
MAPWGSGRGEDPRGRTGRKAEVLQAGASSRRLGAGRPASCERNQLLTKGMVILRDKIRFYEGQKLLDSLAETWDFFFSDVLPTLQAVFYPVQDALARAHARVPPAVVQMLLVLQGVHESRGVTKDYLRLETLIQKVVSPYLGTYGLYSSEGAFTHSCILEKHFLRRSRSGDILAKNPVVRSKSYNTPLLNPMTSCPEPQGFADTPGQDPAGTFRPSPAPPSGPCPSRLTGKVPRGGGRERKQASLSGTRLGGWCPKPVPGLRTNENALGPVLPSPPECRGLYRGGLSAATSWAAGPALIPGDSAGTCWHTAPRPGMTFVCGGP